MPKERLKSLLSDLHRELDQTPSLDPELAARLRQAAKDVDNRLTASAEAETIETSREEEGLIAELLEADQRFEVAHPTIAGTLRQILATLSNMGI
jgi:hypothetical protein